MNQAGIDKSKNIALIPPDFGSPTSNLRGSGEPLTPITVSDYNHAWNEVYAGGKWETADMGYYDVGRPQAALFIQNFQRTDENPKKTKFAKELLVPMSTKGWQSKNWTPKP